MRVLVLRGSGNCIMAVRSQAGCDADSWTGRKKRRRAPLAAAVQNEAVLSALRSETLPPSGIGYNKEMFEVWDLVLFWRMRKLIGLAVMLGLIPLSGCSRGQSQTSGSDQSTASFPPTNKPSISMTTTNTQTFQ